MQRVRRNRVDRAIGAQVLRLIDVQRDAPFERRPTGDQRIMAEIFAGEHFEIVERARDHRGNHHRLDIFPAIAAQREQLAEPDRIFIRRPARIGGDAPARLDLATALGSRGDERENHIGISRIDREQHDPLPYTRNTSAAWMTRHVPSAKRSRNAPSGVRPS